MKYRKGSMVVFERANGDLEIGLRFGVLTPEPEAHNDSEGRRLEWEGRMVIQATDVPDLIDILTCRANHRRAPHPSRTMTCCGVEVLP